MKKIVVVKKKAPRKPARKGVYVKVSKSTKKD